MVFLDLFSDTAESYASARPRYPDALFEQLAFLAPSTSRAWDCGTGNGQAAIGLARWFSDVSAPDASAEQIHSAIQNERIRYAVAPAEESGLPESHFDLVSVAQALHWFDRPRFYAEVHRVLKPGGLLAAYGYSWFYVDSDIDRVVDRYLLRPLAGHWAPNNQLLWDGYRTIEFPFKEIEPPRLAIHLNWTLQELLAYYCTWSATRSYRRAVGDEALRESCNALQLAWGDSIKTRAVVMPLAIRLGYSIR